MIKLKCPLLWDGHLIPAGKTLALTSELEEKIVAAGNGEFAAGIPVSEPGLDADVGIPANAMGEPSGGAEQREESEELPAGDAELQLGRSGRAQ